MPLMESYLQALIGLILIKSMTSVLRNIRTVEDGEWMGIGTFYQSSIHTVHSLEVVGAIMNKCGKTLILLWHFLIIMI